MFLAPLGKDERNPFHDDTMTHSPNHSPLQEELLSEIQLTGPLSFARYMELSLYHPLWGYYEQEPGKIGKGGDFYTSVSVGPLFGQLLCEQFIIWSRTLNWPGPWVWVETGAHAGQLALDILERVERLGLIGQLHYHIVEPSPTRQAWQKKTLARFTNVYWHRTLSEFSAPLTAILFSNELLDAFPCQLFERDEKGSWLELRVGQLQGELQWVKSPAPLPPALLSLVREELPPGYRLEHSASAITWWKEACGLLQHGYLVTLDYGVRDSELSQGMKPASTLRAIAHHQHQENWLNAPGQTDLSTAVHWDEVIQAGQAAGLVTHLFTSQERFLMGIIQTLHAQGRVCLSTPASGEEKLPTDRPELLHLSPPALKTLTHPQYLGSSFQTLVQFRA